ncbi:TIGR04222 domain-containing membrane protein [Streptomyces sp. NBC_00234]|uniref:TIGR04222 domain-containing membrane protein n=1 Tax=Streptomyces sp. NBC_00234 TaxID=2903638 RepID=UPI002E2A04F2|nr:TIGR04222 domain-containing membrane protein [Streptomyces sp. NBC_00234]
MWTVLIRIDVVVTLTACAGSLALSGRRPWRARHPALGPYELAYLAGGPQRVVEAALYTLWGADSRFTAGAAGRLRLGPPRPDTGAPVERALVEAWHAAGGGSPARLRARGARSDAVREVGDRLVAYGLAPRPRRTGARRAAAHLLTAAVCATAALTVATEVRAAPHLRALLLLGGTALLVRVLCPARSLRTPAGRRRLATARRTAPWAGGELGAVVLDGHSGLPDTPGGSRRRGGPGGLPSIGRQLRKMGKALEREEDRHSDQTPDSTGGHHHGCGSGGGCGGGND